MQTRLKLLHIWQRQLSAMLGEVRVTQVRGLALLVVGMLIAGTVRLPAVAAALPLTVRDESRTRRLRRWLANDRVVVDTLWPPLRRALLRDVAGRDLVLVFDPTPQAGHATVLVLGLLQHKRVLPLAWRIVPQQAPWEERLATYLGAMVTEVAQDLPPGCHVTVVADRGITGPATLAVVRAAGWHVVFRLNVGASQTNRVRVAGVEHHLWTWIEAQGFAWAGPVELFKAAGWVRVELTVVWDRTYDEPWVLVSDEPAGPQRVHAYRRRTRIEATFADTKRRGFDLERTKIVDPARLNRLLLALVITLWWRTQMGLRVIRTGLRARYDRRDRRDRSVLQLAGRHIVERLLHDRCPALPFSRANGRLRYAFYA